MIIKFFNSGNMWKVNYISLLELLKLECLFGYFSFFFF